MTETAPRRPRSDGTRNRDRIIEAARIVYARDGYDAALESVARHAGVSRTTLYRHFPNREDLAATLYEENMSLIEARAQELSEHPEGVVELFDYVLDLQAQDRSLARMLAMEDLAWLQSLSDRAAAAFEPLLARGRREGVVHSHVDTQDVMLAFPMAAGVLQDPSPDGHTDRRERLTRMLHRALFTHEV